VLLLADRASDAPAGVLLEGLLGVLQESIQLRGRGGRHSRRQVNEPPWVDREPAHDLQCCGGVFLWDLDLAGVRCLEPPAAPHVVDLEDGLLAVGSRRERPNGLVPLLLCWNGDDLALGVAQRGQ